jgi:hypothetical protein
MILLTNCSFGVKQQSLTHSLYDKTFIAFVMYDNEYLIEINFRLLLNILNLMLNIISVNCVIEFTFDL